METLRTEKPLTDEEKFELCVARRVWEQIAEGVDQSRYQPQEAENLYGSWFPNIPHAA